jgi:hypothetical protein
MRTFSVISRLAWVLVFPLLLSCISPYDEDNDTTCIKSGLTYEAIFEVSPETSEGYGLDGIEGGVVEYMKIRRQGKTDWDYLHMGAIKSFDYAKEHEYILKLRVTHLVNPPTDASSNVYELVEILSDKLYTNN